MALFCLTICALSMVLGDISASFILPNVPGQQWVKVGYLNMTDPTQQCPYPWQNVTSPVASCGKKAGVPCGSVNIITGGASYQMVCGRLLGYQVGTPDGFSSCCAGLGQTLETYYVDGISITYGSPGNRHHVYTYAAGWSEFQNSLSCPCAGGTSPPVFVGSDYYCESGNPNTTADVNTFYYADALWDRQRCRNDEATCCDPRNIPWFCKTFPTNITENLEVRICLDEGLDNENVAIQFFELYILVDSNIQASPSLTGAEIHIVPTITRTNTSFDSNIQVHVSPSLTEAETHIVPTIASTNISIGVVPIGLISGAAVVVVLSLVIAIIVAIKCCFVKRKAPNHLDNIDNNELEDNNTYEVVIKRTPLDIKDMQMEPCCAYGVVK